MDSSGPIEVVLSTDLRSEPYNFPLWDIQTGAQLILFKGLKGNTIPKCLQLIDENYFVTANDNILHFWSIFNKKCQDQKLFLPGRPTSLCVSPCGNYICVGISEMIFVWHLRTGNLLANAQRHYQTVSVLKFNRDGTFLFSAGEDGLVLVWPFADLISNTHHLGALNRRGDQQNSGVSEPRFTWQHHSSQVTDLHVSNGSICITVSADSCANIYNYIDGKRLFNVVLPSPIWSVTMDKNETRIFLGSQIGDIYEMCVSSISLSLLNSKDKESDEARRPTFKGHKGKVVGLIVSMDGSKLISASLDSTCKIWDIHRKKLLQDIKHQAPLANLTSLLVPESFALTTMTQSQTKPPMLLKPLKRSLYKNPRDTVVALEDLFDETCTPIILTNCSSENRNLSANCNDESMDDSQENQSDFIRNAKRPRLDMNDKTLIENGLEHSSPTDDNGEDSRGDNKKTVRNLRNKLRNLYLLATDKLFNDAASSQALKIFEPLIKDHK